jgi:hypothetical protein
VATRARKLTPSKHDPNKLPTLWDQLKKQIDKDLSDSIEAIMVASMNTKSKR